VTRHFLLVQGNSSPFFMALAKALDARGHGVSKINFSGGDYALWGDWKAVDFSGRFDEFKPFLTDYCQAHGVTDLIFHNDCRPFHRLASEVVVEQKLIAWVYEEGYLRPNWLTLERGGINGFSRMPDDPAWYLHQAAALPPCDDAPVGAGFRGRVLYDFKWQGMNYLHTRRYPHFKTHRPYPIWAEYLTWAKRLSLIHWRRRQAARAINELIEKRRRFFLFPLQLDSDSQLRIHSDFKRLAPAIEFVISDFAANAGVDSCLLVKGHPLDNGWANFRRLVSTLGRANGVSSRILYVDGGDLDLILGHCAGVVTINSTVGMTALAQRLPVALLGRAVYGVPGLVSAGELAQFWGDPKPPDSDLLEAFLRVLRHAALVNGNYYTPEGVALAVDESVRRMEMEHHILDGAPLPGRLT